MPGAHNSYRASSVEGASVEAASATGDTQHALPNGVAAIEALADQFALAEISEADTKYLAQRAYNAHRGKRACEEKLARGKRNKPV